MTNTKIGEKISSCNTLKTYCETKSTHNSFIEITLQKAIIINKLESTNSPTIVDKIILSQINLLYLTLFLANAL